jgi:hypothetical protein
MLSQQPAIASLRMSACPTALALLPSTRLELQASTIDTIDTRHYQLATAASAHGSFIMCISGKVGLRPKFAHLRDIGSDNHELRHDPQYPPDLHGILIAAHLSEISLAYNPQAKG